MGGNGQSAGAGRTSVRPRSSRQSVAQALANARPRTTARTRSHQPAPTNTRKMGPNPVSPADDAIMKSGKLIPPPRVNALGRNVPNAQVAQIQRQMGQTGDEAGKVGVSPFQKTYVGTSKSYNINQYLMTSGKSLKARGSQWDTLGFTKADARNTIKAMDAGMKPLPDNYKVNRFVYPEQLKQMIGGNFSDTNMGAIISALKSGDASTVTMFNNLLKGAQYVHKAYTSTTYLDKHPSFDLRQIRLRGVAKKGTKAIVTNNHQETEIILGRKLKYNFTGNWEVVRTSKGVEQLILDVYYG